MTDASASVLVFTVDPAFHLERLDRVLVEATPLTRSQAAKQIKDQRVSINGTIATRSAAKVHTGDIVRVEPSGPQSTDEESLEAERIPLKIVFEDDDILVIDKAAGMVVHPAPGHDSGTLVHALLAYYPPIAAIGEPNRPGIVHRLDRDTSGLLVVAKSQRAYDELRAQFAAQTVYRQYAAVVVRMRGPGIDLEGTFHTRHGRHPLDRKKFTGLEGPREAITHYKMVEDFRHGAFLIRCQLQTGRTHQIRVHLSEHGSPIMGDELYGGRAAASASIVRRMALHAEDVRFTLPWSGEHAFHSDIPNDILHALQKLRNGAPWR